MLSVLHLLSCSGGKAQRECFGLNVVFVIAEFAVSSVLSTTEVSSLVSVFVANVSLRLVIVTRMPERREFSDHAQSVCFSAHASVG